eukprot:8154080-Pyramimonas_sp.AAC.1
MPPGIPACNEKATDAAGFGSLIGLGKPTDAGFESLIGLGKALPTPPAVGRELPSVQSPNYHAEMTICSEGSLYSTNNQHVGCWLSTDPHNMLVAG